MKLLVLLAFICVSKCVVATLESLKHDFSGFAINKRFPMGVVEACREPGTVTLTFDDGMTPRAMQRLLPFLKEHNLPATIFLIGNTLDPSHWNYRENVKAVEMAAKDGHIIASHSWSHPDMTSLPSDEAVKDELLKTMKVIEHVIGAYPRYFRPPMGATDDRLLRICKELGLTVVGWNINTEDWKNPPEMVIQNVREELDRARPVPELQRQRTKCLGGAKAFGTGFILLQHEPKFDEKVMLEVLDELRLNNIRIVSAQECFGELPYRKTLLLNGPGVALDQSPKIVNPKFHEPDHRVKPKKPHRKRKN